MRTLDYVPDPFELQISALIMFRRVSSLNLSKVAVEELSLLAARFFEVADKMSTGLVTPFNPSSEEQLTDQEVAFQTGDLICMEQRIDRPTIGMEIRHYVLFQRGGLTCGLPNEIVRAPKSIAGIDLIQHPTGIWQVMHVDVNTDLRRKGIATLLYDQVEARMQASITPSGWLSTDAYEFWKDRKPELVQFHRLSPMESGLYVNPKQIGNVVYVLADRPES